MCGAPKAQTVTTEAKLDPTLQALLYGGQIPGGGIGDLGVSAADGMSGGMSGGGGGNDRDQSSMAMGGNAVTNRTPEEQNRAINNMRRFNNAIGRDTGPSAAARASAGFGDQGTFDGGLFAMGGMVAPQQGLASLNQGQMPMMNGQMPNLSDPMVAATMAMAMRSPQMQYGSIAGAPPMQTQFNVGGYVEGPGTGTSDSVDSVILQNGVPVQEALLSDGEFVMTEKAVKGAGNGDREAGAARMYEMMRQFERGGRV